MSRSIAIAIVALAAGLLSACSSSPDGLSIDEQQPLPTFDELPLSALIDTYGGTGEAAWLAIEDAVASCMRAQGFEYTPEPVPAGFGEGEVSEPVGRAEFIDEAFGVPRAFSGTAEPDADIASANDGYVAALGPAERDSFNAALFGAGDGSTGCLAEARRQVEEPAAAEVVSQLRSERDRSTETANQAPQVASARGEVYRCLREQGADGLDTEIPFPDAALTELFEQRWFDPSRQASEAIEDARRWAETLWDCGYPTYQAIWFAERERIESAYIRDNPGVIEALTGSRD